MSTNDSTDLGGGATIPRKSGDPGNTDLGDGATIAADKRAQAPTHSESSVKEPTVSAPDSAPAETPHGATTGSQIDSKTVVMSPTEKEAAANAPLLDRTVPSGLVAGRKLGEKGRFTLLRQLGKGGMGVVWLASDENYNNKEVALKLLPPDIASDPEALKDLKKETVVTRELTHAHIIRIHDLHGGDGEPAFVSMEFVNGPNLRKKLSEQKPYPHFKWDDVRPLVLSLCDALEYAHEQGVIHRDLKPANLMLDSKNKLKLADFGIAATVANSMSRTASGGGSDGDNSGTLLYMSPQQMRGVKAAKTDDFYSFGATVYELLTGKPPFYNGGQSAIMYQIRNEMPQSIKERLEEFGSTCEVPDHVSETIMACLAKEPKDRPQSAADIKSRLSGQGKLAPAQPDLGVPKKDLSAPAAATNTSVNANINANTGTPTEKAMLVGDTSGKLLDVSFADTKHPQNNNSNAIKFAITCVVILLVLGLAWHFVSMQRSSTGPNISDGSGKSDTSYKTGTAGKADTTGGSGDLAKKDLGGGTADGGTKTDLSGNTDTGAKTDGTAHAQVVYTGPPRLVILPDVLSDSARAQFDRNLREQLGVDEPGPVEVSLSGYLRDAFVASKGFAVLERSQLKQAVGEIDLNAGKYGDAEISKIGHLSSADYILVPEITSISISKKTTQLLNIPDPRITITAVIQGSLRLFNAQTSTIISSTPFNTTDSTSQMHEPADKLQAARDVIAKVMNKVVQTGLDKANKDVLHIEPPAAPAK